MVLRKQTCVCCNIAVKPLFVFPKDPQRFRTWIHRLKLDELLDLHEPTYIRNNGRVCSLHFQESAFTSTLKTKLTKFAVPVDLRNVDTSLLASSPSTSRNVMPIISQESPFTPSTREGKNVAVSPKTREIYRLRCKVSKLKKKLFNSKKIQGFEYSRSGNPTRQCLEECIAALEGAQYALCFASGLATTMSLTHLLQFGDHVICFDDLYGGTNRYFRTCASKMGIEVSFVDMRDIDNVRKAIKSNTKMIWIETPTNPTMKLVDIQGISDLLKSYSDIISVVDNTFMSSYFQKPLKLGAHVVMHSLTKYMNGHSDVVMGAIATNDEEIHKRMKYLQNSLGTVPSPFDCFLVNRGLKTLHVRMEKHMENGLAVAKFLENHKSVEKVIYPGLESHPQYELAKRQTTGASGMVSFYVKGGLSEAQKFIKNLKVFTLAESLGSIESLVEIPSLMTHASVLPEDRKKLGISDNLIRLSVGLESIKDLLKDLDQALQISQQFD